MKRLTIIASVTACFVVSAFAQNADFKVTANSNQNVQIQLNPNGPLDAAPAWTVNGPGSMQAQAATSFLFVTNGAGVTTITFIGTSFGNFITNRVIVTVVTPPPPPTPATTLNPSVTFVPK